MITVTLTASGTVGLSPVNRADLNRLRQIPYVLCKGRTAVTYWTYLADLRRDVPRTQLKFASHVASRLRKLKNDVDGARTGDDKRVLSVFAPDRKPYPFQLEAIHSALNMRRILIADDTGLGKTIETIGTMLVLLQERKIKRAVLVVPAGLKLQWAEQIEEFARRTPDPMIVVPSGNPAYRRELYRRDWRVLIVNRELVRIDRKYLKQIMRTVDFVAIDEASCMCNEEAQTTICMRQLFARTPYRLALTATPIENRLADIWSIVRWVDPRAFLSRKYFDRRYIVWRKMLISVWSNRAKRKVKIVKYEPLRYRNLREVHSKIRHCYIRRRVSEVGLQLPELIVQWDRLKLPKRQRDCYDAVKDKLKDKIKKLRGAALKAPLQALRQACNSTALVEKEAGQSHSHVKIDRIRELLAGEFVDEQVLIFSDYERFCRLMARELADSKPVLYTGKMTDRERLRSAEAFKLGDRRILIGTKSLERGHNLQCAAIVINADLPFNPAAIKQRIGRVRRIKSKHTTTRVWNLLVSDTVEENLILRRIYSKRKLFEGIFTDDELTDADPLESMAGAKLWDLL